jgi:hypothetical protein
MFRSMSRVAVVAIVVFSFVVASIPAYAAPQSGGKAAIKTESSWLQSAVSWLSQAVYGNKAIKPPKSSTKRAGTGPCVDPFGGRCAG